MSVFVSMEFPDDELVKLLSTYGELKSANLRRLHYPEDREEIVDLLAFIFAYLPTYNIFLHFDNFAKIGII